MPAVPEIGKAARKIGLAEIRGKLNAEQTTDAAHHTGVSSKIVLKPESIDQQAQPEVEW